MLNEDLKILIKEKEKEIYKKNDNDNYDIIFKLIIIGDSGVGKSSLALNITRNIFIPNIESTLGFEYAVWNLQIEDKKVKLEIWDTCGQEIYRSLISSFYKRSSLAIMIYSIDNKESFKHLEEWLNEIKTYSNPNIKIVLIGNKCDLEENREIKKEEGEKFSNEHNFSFFMETSAKTGFNAKNLFKEAAKILYKEYIDLKKSFHSSESSLDSSSKTLASFLSVEIDNENEYRRKKCFC